MRAGDEEMVELLATVRRISAQLADVQARLPPSLGTIPQADPGNVDDVYELASELYDAVLDAQGKIDKHRLGVSR